VTANPRDGFFDRWVSRRVSASVTRRLAATPLSPNAVTVVATLCGAAGGLALALAWPLGPIAGVALLAFSAVLDCCDGELARLRGQESRLGHVLDVTGDTVVHAAVFAGIAWSLANAGAAPDGWTLAALALGLTGSFAAVTWSESVDARRRRTDGWENRILDGLVGPLSTRDWYVFPLAFAATGRLDLLLAGAAVGANAFWAAVAVLVARALRRSST
jgi:phosphatidylglycerophosphate synthase